MDSGKSFSKSSQRVGGICLNLREAEGGGTGKKIFLLIMRQTDAIRGMGYRRGLTNAPGRFSTC